MDSGDGADLPAAAGDEGRPLKLIHIDEEGRCHLQPEAAQTLSQIQGKVATIGIAGLYRTGKSFLLNRLLGLQGGFELGPSVNPCTKGLWIWSRPVQLEDGCQCVLIDTEGLGSALRTASCDMQILSLCVLLSSSFIYNSMGAIDEQAIDELHLVLHLAQHIHAKAGGENTTDLSQHFPSFLWVLRDFHLRLVDENGTAVSERDYLERALQPLPGQEEKNKVRSAIQELFRTRDCTALVRPVADESELRHIERLPFEALRPQFRTQVGDFVRKVYDGVTPKLVKGTCISGEMLVGLASAYCDAINHGAVPTIHCAWTAVVQQQMRVCRLKALDVYGSQLSSAGLPMSEERLHELHKAAKAMAMEVFQAQGFGDGDPGFQENRAEFARRAKQSHEDMRLQNSKASKELCEKVAHELYCGQIESKLNARGSYESLEQLMNDWEQLRAEYADKTEGPAQDEVLSTWVFQRMTESVQRLSTSLQRAANERYSHLQQRLSEAELRRRRSESVERLLLSAPTVTERHLVPTLTEQSRLYRESVIKRKEGQCAGADLGDQGLRAGQAWAELTAASEGALQAAPRPALQQALALAAARMLEVELLHAGGLQGLGGELQPESRRGLLLRVLELLNNTDSLGRVGKALVEGSTIPVGAAAAGPLLPLLVQSLVEAACEVARAGQVRHMRGLLEFADLLGLAEAVRGGRSQSKAFKGARPVDLAAAAGHNRVTRLLQQWPAGPEGGCLGLGVKLSSRESSLGQRVKGCVTAALRWRSPMNYGAFGGA